MTIIEKDKDMVSQFRWFVAWERGLSEPHFIPIPREAPKEDYTIILTGYDYVQECPDNSYMESSFRSS